MVGDHGAFLALEQQGLRFRRVESPRVIEDVLRREDAVLARASRETRREIDGIAHHRVGAPTGGADIAGENVAPVDADAQRHLGARGEDVADASQHRLLVLTRARGSAGREVDLDRAGIDIRLEPRQPVRVACDGHRGGDPVEILE